jgi:glutamate dehydrogenase/leucine dehydrogenase/methionyl-tRNA synthetase
MSRNDRLQHAAERRRNSARLVRQWSIPAFLGVLEKAQIRRAYVLHENGEFQLSHKELQPIQAFCELSHDFADHEGVFLSREDGIPALFAAFVHDTRRGLSQGGLRLWKYDSLADVVTDGLRLSQGMTRKNALAGLHWGGGKGIITLPPHVASVEAFKRPELAQERRQLFEAYGRFVASLDGVYYTAEDMGTDTADMNVLLSRNRFTTCVGGELGGSGNPSAHTAWGVFRAMQAAWRHLHGFEELRGVHVAIQGAGNVGGPLIDYLYRAGARLTVGEFAPETRKKIRAAYPEVIVLDDHNCIFDVAADIFAPCARGNVLTAETVPRLNVQLVCGAANNQLGEPHDAERMNARGILFVPDYLCNRMGITNCADEWAGYLQEDVRLAAERVHSDTLRVLRHAKALRISTAEAADRLADIAAADLHPMIGHRGRRIVDYLVRARWSEPAKTGNISSHPQTIFIGPAHESRMHREDERRNAFTGTGPAVAAMPLSTASRPHLGMLLSPLLMDVEARRRGNAKRVIGLDHGGASLQHAVRESLPYEVAEITRGDFLLECHDRHAENSAAIRRQLAQAGIGYDAWHWIDPMSTDASAAVRQLFYRLHDSGRITPGEYAGYRCPQCETVLSDSELLDVNEQSRCERCQSPVERQTSEQIFLSLDSAARELIEVIEHGEFTFSDAQSAKAVLNQLRTLKPMCISRQSWWGHELPTHPEDVLSPWFTLAAWSLQGAGWPADPAPAPIDTVFVDSTFLARWVVPSQLIAMAVYGRPVFCHVEVPGAVYVVERENEDQRPVESCDEERYAYRTVMRRMSPRLGNVVEPASLVQRFGADALRLWYLLSLRANDRTAVILTEARARDSRHAIARLNAALSSLLPLGSLVPQELSPVDEALIAEIQYIADEALAAYPRHRFDLVARHFLEAIGRVSAYARVMEEKSAARYARPTATRVIRILDSAFSPLCPFIVRRFVEEVSPSPPVDDGVRHAWVKQLVSLTRAASGGGVSISCHDLVVKAAAQQYSEDLSRVLGRTFRWTDLPPRGRATVSGPFVLVEEGEGELPAGDDPTSLWYRALHSHPP